MRRDSAAAAASVINEHLTGTFTTTCWCGEVTTDPARHIAEELAAAGLLQLSSPTTGR